MDRIFLLIQQIGENVDIQHFRIRPMMIKAIFKTEVKIIEADRTETNKTKPTPKNTDWHFPGMENQSIEGVDQYWSKVCGAIS